MKASKHDRPFTLSLLIIASLAGFTGYCAALIDWVQDLSTGTYTQNPFEATLETSALLLYTYLAIRFFTKKISLF